MRYKKGECGFYKGSSPKNLREYLKKFPELEERVNYFLEEYCYNYVKKLWNKKDKI